MKLASCVVAGKVDRFKRRLPGYAGCSGAAVLHICASIHEYCKRTSNDDPSSDFQKQLARFCKVLGSCEQQSSRVVGVVIDYARNALVSGKVQYTLTELAEVLKSFRPNTTTGLGICGFSELSKLLAFMRVDLLA